MINFAVSAARRMPVWLASMALLGVLIGVFAAPGSNALWAVYDESNPVLSVQARVQMADDDKVVVALRAKKYRTCEYLRLQAYTRRSDGTLSDAQIRRADQPEDGDTKPIGQFDLGTWIIWPRDNGVGVVIYSQHSCYGRLVQTRLANVDLPKT